MHVGDGLKALVLEDDEAAQTLLAKLLQKEGFEVTVASDGLDGLVKLESMRPDIILCDVMMPHLDGATFTRAIKGHQSTRDIPVIMVSARNDTKSIVEGINVGARFYLTKPYKHEELLAKVKKALGR